MHTTVSWRHTMLTTLPTVVNSTTERPQLITCRMAAPELCHCPEAQRTSVQKQTHLLCPFTFQFGLETINCPCHHSIFHLNTTRWENKYFLISLLHRHLTSFNECPRVLPDASIRNISVNGMEKNHGPFWKPLLNPLDFDVLPKSTVPVSVTWLHIVTTYHSSESVLHFLKKLFILLIMWRPSRYAVFQMRTN